MNDPDIVVLHPVKTFGELETALSDEEIGFEVVSFGVGEQPDGTRVNFVREIENLSFATGDAAPPPLAALTLAVPPGGTVDEAFIQSLIDQNMQVIPGSFSGIIDGGLVEFVVCRAMVSGQSNPITVRGKMSFFGGPDDSGVGEEEGLALIEPSEMPLFPANLFLTAEQAHAPGLARRLNPKKPYIACRWEELGLPIRRFRKYLQSVSIEVENVANGQKIAGVRAVDEGPGIVTRIADLSPVFQGIGLDSDDQVILRIPRPVQTAPAVLGERHSIDQFSGLNDKVEIPPMGTFNVGLSAASESTMLALLGVPGEKSTECSSPGHHLAPLIANRVNVGPFVVSGLRVAVESLKTIFAELQEQFPQVYAQVRTDDLGMLCVRHRRLNSNVFSNHSWGTAIDLKFGDQEIEQGTQITQRGFLSLFPIFNKHGWYWGAGFSGRSVDSMHFECSEQLIRDMQA